jgi:hypothetical protein
VKRARTKSHGRASVRLTIDIPAELSVRLYAIALECGCGKGAIAARLLAQGAARYRSDRAVRAEILGQGDAA